MRNIAYRCIPLLALAFTLGACAKNPVISIPPPPAARMFVADLVNGVVVFTQPIGASSAPSFTLAGAGATGVAFDSRGTLFVSNNSTNSIAVYFSPISATSTPAFTIGPVPGAASLTGDTFDSAGNLWVADQTGEAFEFTPPFSSGSVPVVTMTGMAFGPVGLTFDRAGNLLVAGYGSSSVTIFRPPFVNGPNVPAGTIALPIGGGGVGIDTKDDLLAGQADGTLAIVKGPFATGSPVGPIIGQTFLGGNPLNPAVESLNTSVDASGNLWVPFGGDGGLAPPPPVGGANEFGVAEFTPPFSGSSQSDFGLLQTGLAFPISIAWGP